MDNEFFNIDDVNSIKKGLRDIAQGQVHHFVYSNLVSEPLPIYNEDKLFVENRIYCYSTSILKARKSWAILFSDEFKNALKKLDKEMQRRILECIVDLSMEPLAVKGDTIKPLQGKQLKGVWRYRLGDYRLLYHPNKEDMTINLVTIASRGEVYA